MALTQYTDKIMISRNKILNKNCSWKKVGVSLGLIIFAGFLFSSIGGFGQADIFIDALLGGGSVQTSTFWSGEAWNLSSTAEDADLIVTGEVTDVSSAEWNTSDDLRPENITSKDIEGIHHYATINVNEMLKGSKKDRIRIRVNSGEVGRYSKMSSSTPKYREGEKVLVYVQRWQGHYETFNQKYGKFNLENEIITQDAPEGHSQRINITELIRQHREKYSTK